MEIKKQKNNFIKLSTVLMIVALASIGLNARSQCIPAFTYTVSPANNGEVSFTNTSSADPSMHYHWDFGDGNHQYVANPLTHTFNGNGPFTVCLNVNDSLGQNDSTKGCNKTYCTTINIANDSATCTAHFYIRNDTAVNGLQFINTSSGTISNYVWDFGDGTTSTLAYPPNHVYQNVGIHIICLTTSNPATLCHSTYCDTVFASSCHASFTYTPDAIGNGLSFTGTSTGNPTAYAWDFGDLNTSTLQNPHHVYARNGTYQVCLKASSPADSSCNNTICQYIGVYNLCDATFNLAPVDSSNLYNYRAYVYNPDKNLTYLWDFGDGDSSTLQYPTHTFAGNGPYQLCLTVTGSNGCADTYCDSLYAGRTNGITFSVVSKIAVNVPENNLNNSNSLSNYPNPFNKTTTIAYSIKQDATVELNVIDLLGKKIALIDSGNKTSGKHSIQWNAENIPSGIYLLQLKINNELLTKKLVITQ